MTAFDMVDVLRLDVVTDIPEGVLRNLVPNPSGEFGGWGWLSPIDNTVVGPFGQPLVLRTLAAQAAHFTTEPMPVDGTHVKGQFSVAGSTPGGGVGVKARFEFLDADGALISSGPQTAVTTTDTGYPVPAAACPAGTVAIRLRFDLYRSGGNPSAGDYVSLVNVFVATGALAEFSNPLRVEDEWVNILGPTHEITIERAELDLGTLTATILDATLDPSQSTTIRAGKKVRLVAQTLGDEILFAGEIRKAQVAYDLLNTDATKRARITLTAVDQATPLSNTTRPDGVAAVDELPAVFEGCRVPWNVNGNTGHTATTPVVVSRNENASAIDQVAITRDSNLGYAWFDRRGVVQVWDAADLAAAFPAPFPLLDEDVYNADVSIDYDTERCINHVTVKYLRVDPVTGETQEVTYGPYTDETSRRDWGTHAAEFTVHGITEDTATLEAYAAAILAANATPAVRLNEATVPILTTDDITDWALRDLYDLVTLTPPTAAP